MAIWKENILIVRNVQLNNLARFIPEFVVISGPWLNGILGKESNTLKEKHLKLERKILGNKTKRKSPMLRRRHSEDTKEKIRKARLERKRKLGYINSPETKKKMSEVFKGRKLSEATKRKISSTFKGKRSHLLPKNIKGN